MRDRTRPLFRTRATLATATQAAAAMMPPTAHRRIAVTCIDDVTDWIGRDVTSLLYEQIIKRVSALGWSMDTVARGDLVHITRLSAKANCDERTNQKRTGLADRSDLQADRASLPASTERSPAGQN